VPFLLSDFCGGDVMIDVYEKLELLCLRSAKGAEYDSQGASAEQSEARRPWG